MVRPAYKRTETTAPARPEACKHRTATNDGRPDHPPTGARTKHTNNPRRLETD